MKSYEPDFDEDGVPWASPEIQRDYEAALGRFIVAFNAVDNLLARVIETVLIKVGRMDLVKPCTEAGYSQKLLTLDLLKQSSAGRGIAEVPVALMHEVGAHRNKVVHGHFEQNPCSGEYEIIAKKAHRYSPTDLDAQTAEAIKAWHALRHSDAFYAFDAVTVSPP
jgi:hypothetical protein